MKFSVIIPIYNVGQYLVPCVESVLNQTFSDFEIILVDDGSSDDSPAICDKFAEMHDMIRVVHQTNAGLSCARNSGISIARGEYICFLDADDFWLNDQFLEQLSLKTTGKPDIICFGIQKFHEKNNTWSSPIIPRFEATRNYIPAIIRQLNKGTFSVTAPTKSIRREFLINNRISFQPGLIGEDSDWLFKLLFHKPSIDCLSINVIAYRQRESSISHSINPKGFTDNLWILEHWIEQINNQIHTEEERKTLLSICAYLYANLLVIFSWQVKTTQMEYFPRVQSLKWVTSYAQSKRARIIKRFVKLVGIHGTIQLLTVYSFLKRK